MLYAKDGAGKPRQAILKGIQMIAKRQCKITLSEQLIIEQPLKATYDTVFKMITLGITQDLQLS